MDKSDPLSDRSRFGEAPDRAYPIERGVIVGGTFSRLDAVAQGYRAGGGGHANDAVGLAQIVRTGWYREVAAKSEHSHRTPGLLAARAKLVGMRKEISNQLRGPLKAFGHVIGAVGGEIQRACA